MKELTAREAAELLQISLGSVKNWVSNGLLQPIAKNRFDAGAVQQLKARIASGEVARLQQRANKKAGVSYLALSEYRLSPGTREAIVQMQQRCIAPTPASVDVDVFDVNAVMYAVTLRLLVLRGELERRQPILAPIDVGNWKRRVIYDEMVRWYATLPASLVNESRATTTAGAYVSLADGLSEADGEDVLGALYQLLTNTGSRAQTGSFYTPQWLIDEMCDGCDALAGTMLDPCCGTGRFLLGAQRKGVALDRLWGIDVDAVAVRIARINLLLAAGEATRPPPVHCIDFLGDLSSLSLPRTFDFIATNPPWGRYSGSLDARYDSGWQVNSRESFSLFLLRALSLLPHGGRLSFVLPEAICHVRTHGEARRMLLETTRISQLHLLGRIFKKVFTPVIRLDIEKRQPTTDTRILVRSSRGAHHWLTQARLRTAPDCTIDAYLSDTGAAVVEQMYRVPHFSLADNARWALGIVTGNNQKHLVAATEPGAEPVVKGSHIAAYDIALPDCGLNCSPSAYQQMAPLEMYRAPEKLVYRFIATRPVMALDTEGRLTLNSANIVIPAVPDVPMTYYLAYFNSSLFGWVFEKKFHTRKILKYQLEQLPLPRLDVQRLAQLDALVRRQMCGENLRREIDCFVLDSFGLDAHPS